MRFWPSLKPSSRNCAKKAWYKVEPNGVLRLGPRTPIRTTVLACCARAESGHPSAAPPSSVMASRRLMGAYHTVAQERRCASQQKLCADVADGSDSNLQR